MLLSESCPTLWDPMDYSWPGSSVHEILQARILEWVAICFSRGVFLTEGLNLGLLHCKWILYHLSHPGKPITLRTCVHLPTSACVCVQSSLTFVTPWTAVCQAPLSMESSRREYWSGSLFSIARDRPNPGIETVSPASPALVGRLFTTARPG